MQYRRVGKEGSTKASHIEGFFRLDLQGYCYDLA
jgi:hypothetical protein